MAVLPGQVRPDLQAHGHQRETLPGGFKALGTGLRYVCSDMWAARILTAWPQRVRRSRLQPLQRVANTLHEHQVVLLGDFHARIVISGGVIEGPDTKVKLTLRKSYGFHTAPIEPAKWHSSMCLGGTTRTVARPQNLFENPK